MSNFDWSQFTVRINVKAPLEKLYWCWATKEGIEYWFLKKSDFKKQDGNLYDAKDFVQRGDIYSWWWHGYADNITESGEILDCNDKDLFQFRFGKAGICTVKIYEEQKEKIVELIQDQIPCDEKESKTGILAAKQDGHSIWQT